VCSVTRTTKTFCTGGLGKAEKQLSGARVSYCRVGVLGEPQTRDSNFVLQRGRDA
jgi:hypothetical protein